MGLLTVQFTCVEIQYTISYNMYNILHNDIVTVMQLTWLQCFTAYSDISLLSLQTSPVQDHARGRGAQHVCQQGEGGGGQEHRGSL